MTPPDDCVNCKKDKTIHLTQIVGGSLKKIDLCADCPHAKNLTDSQTFGMADQLLGLGASDQMEKVSHAETCPNCGFTLRDFRKVGRLGCSVCYATFFPGVEKVLRDTQKGVRHLGKKPKRQQRKEILRDQIDTLQEEMKQAILEEDYEKAARLRDELQRSQYELQESEQRDLPLSLEDKASETKLK